MTLSEQKKKRDLKYWQMEYLKYIIEFSVEFLKPKGNSYCNFKFTRYV